MASFLIAEPFATFTDKSGAPLNNGKLYFGVEGLNPETNPVTVYFDKDLTQPAAQPVRTLHGYPANSNAPSKLYAASTVSMTVRAEDDSLVIASLSTDQIAPYSPDSVIYTREQAQVASIPAPQSLLLVRHGGILCEYERDASGTALQTGDGQWWSPAAGRATPAHWGGLHGYANDASTELQACINWAKTKYDTVGGSGTAGSFVARVDLCDCVWRDTTGDVDITNIRQPGFQIGRGTIFIDATSGMGVQFYGTNNLRLLGGSLHIEGPTDPDNCPDSLCGVGRCEDVGGNPTAISPSPHGTIFIDGCAKKAQYINLGSEVSHIHVICGGNTVESDWAYGVFHTGHMQDAVDVFGSALTSTVCTLPGVADSPFSNILHDYGSSEVLRTSYWNGAITNIALGPTTTVSFNVASTVLTSRQANGQKTYIPKGQAGGVVELEQREFTIENLTIAGDGLSGSFDLQGENSTGYAPYTSGGTVWRKSGQAIFLGAGRGYTFGPRAYALSYAESCIHIHARNATPGDVTLDLQVENQVKHPITIDFGTANAALQSLEVGLLRASQEHVTPFKAVYSGGGTLDIRDLILNVTAHPSTYALFENPAAVSVRNGAIRSPTDVDISGLAGFAGTIQVQAPPSHTLYASKTNAVQAASGAFTLNGQPFATTGTATQTELRAAGNAINTENKTHGKTVVDSTNGVLVYAVGTGPTAPWRKSADDTVLHNPS